MGYVSCVLVAVVCVVLVVESGWAAWAREGGLVLSMCLL